MLHYSTYSLTARLLLQTSCDYTFTIAAMHNAMQWQCVGPVIVMSASMSQDVQINK